MPVLSLHKFLLIKILTDLSFQEVCAFAQTCKSVYKLSKDDDLWKTIYHKMHPNANPVATHRNISNFKSSYFDLVKNSEVFVTNAQKQIYSYSSFEKPSPGHAMASGKYLFRQVGDNKVEISDMTLGKSCALEGKEKMMLLAASPNRLATTDQEGCLTLWDIETMERIGVANFWTHNEVLAAKIKIVPDANYCCFLTNCRFNVWDLKDKKMIPILSGFEDHSHVQTIDCKFINNYCFLRTGPDTITCLNLKTKEETVITNQPGPSLARCCDYDIDENSVLRFPNHTAHIQRWNMKTGKPLPHLDLGENLDYAIVRGNFIVTQTGKTNIKIFNKQTKNCLHSLKHDDKELIEWRFINKDFLFTASSTLTKIWSIERRQMLACSRRGIQTPLPSGRRLFDCRFELPRVAVLEHSSRNALLDSSKNRSD